MFLLIYVFCFLLFYYTFSKFLYLLSCFDSDNGHERADIEREDSLRSRGPAQPPKKILEISHSMPQMYTNFDSQDPGNGTYLTVKACDEK